MKLLVCSVHDNAVGRFLPPFFCRSKGEAVRMFLDTCNDEKSMFSSHPKDFRLAVLDEWDDESGVFANCNRSSIEWIMTASEAVAPIVEAPPLEVNRRA